MEGILPLGSLAFRFVHDSVHIAGPFCPTTNKLRPRDRGSGELLCGILVLVDNDIAAEQFSSVSVILASISKPRLGHFTLSVVEPVHRLTKNVAQVMSHS